MGWLILLILYNQIRLGVTDTLPLLGSLKDTGHQEGASFILFLKDMPVREFGSIRINVKTAGKLYINNQFHNQMATKGSLLVSFEPGDYVVKIIYGSSIYLAAAGRDYRRGKG